MDLTAFRSLCAPLGQDALRAAEALAPREKDFLAHLQVLERIFPREVARPALETAILRCKAERKFPQRAHSLYFTREALEQASSAVISRYRARRFAGYAFLVDAGCSVGGDTLHLAEAAPTLGIDRDPLRLAMGQANLKALNLWGRARLLHADISLPLPLGSFPPLTGIFFDPARRASRRRLHSVRAYAPPLSTLLSWLPRVAGAGAKISPGVSLDELAPYDCEVEFISLKGELKEAALWFGACRTADRRATLLPGGATLTADPAAEAAPPRLGEPGAFLCEPDPAVLRAGLVRTLARRVDARQIDPAIAYLSCEHPVSSPFLRCWLVEAWMPFQMKRLRAYLRARRVGRVTVKKRGSPLTPEAVQRALKCKGDRRRVLFFTRMNGRPIVIVALPQTTSCERAADAPGQ